MAVLVGGCVCSIPPAALCCTMYVPFMLSCGEGMLPQEFRSAGVGIHYLLHSLGWFGAEVSGGWVT